MEKESVETGEEVFPDSSELSASLINSLSLSDRFGRRDLEVLRRVEGEIELVKDSTVETITKLSRLLGHCSATTVGTCQTLRDQAQDVGESSDSAIRESYSLMSQMEDIDRKMIVVHNATKRIRQISDLLDVLEAKIYAL